MTSITEFQQDINIELAVCREMQGWSERRSKCEGNTDEYYRGCVIAYQAIGDRLAKLAKRYEELVERYEGGE